MTYFSEDDKKKLRHKFFVKKKLKFNNFKFKNYYNRQQNSNLNNDFY